MKVLGLYASPNPDGLTAAMAQAALTGAAAAGAQTELVGLTGLHLERCRQCDRGWGTCRSEGNCVIADDFAELRQRISEADALVLSTPVYFGDLSESAKSFLDRLRRTVAGGRGDLTEGRWVLSIAAAGGGGGGGPTTLVALERYYGVLRIPVFDSLIATRRNREYMLAAAEQAGAALVRHLAASRQQG